MPQFDALVNVVDVDLEGAHIVQDWPASRILELAPCFWKQTLQKPETQQRLAAHVFRSVTLSDHPSAV